MTAPNIGHRFAVARVGFRLSLVAGLVAVVACLTLAAAASAVGTRYCERPNRGLPGYIRATRNVGCGKARRVQDAMFTGRWVNKERCSAYGFTCCSYWNGSYNHLFS